MLLLMLPAALALSGCVATPQPGITNAATPAQDMSAQATAAATSAPLETTQASNKAPVYWIGRSNEQTPSCTVNSVTFRNRIIRSPGRCAS